MLVICPISAFSAWLEVVEECVSSDSPEWVKQTFVCVRGLKDDDLRAVLGSGGRFFTNYEHFTVQTRIFSEAMASRQVHMIVDESHRIKAGDAGARGRAVLSCAHLAHRRDILSGTPAPQSRADLAPQFDFLWNNRRIRNAIEGVGRLRVALEPFFVRSTKKDLGLSDPNRQFRKIPMKPAQAILYTMLQEDLVKGAADLRMHDRKQMDRLRRSVFTMLIFLTNPLRAISQLEVQARLEGNETILKLLRSAAAEGTSSKIDACVEMAEELLLENKKVLIWSAFRSNIDALERRLEHVSPLVMHGGVPTGLEDQEGTREYRRQLFLKSSQHNVMIANPAACSEGMSLHKACHDAIYLDRTFNAAHYLQSIDRIHRLGLEEGVDTNITVLQSHIGPGMPTMDLAVARRMHEKISEMNTLLEDEDIDHIVLFEYEASSDEAEDENIQTFGSIEDIIEAVRLIGTESFDDEETLA